jgi:hypothetical protein
MMASSSIHANPTTAQIAHATFVKLLVLALLKICPDWQPREVAIIDIIRYRQQGF